MDIRKNMNIIKSYNSKFGGLLRCGMVVKFES